MMNEMNDPQNEQQQYEQQIVEPEPAAQQQEYDSDEEDEDYIPSDYRVGSFEFKGIGAGADVWSYWHVASNQLMLHFAGYSRAGAATWNLHVPLNISVRDTFRMCAGMAYEYDQLPGAYLQIHELSYAIDGEVYRSTVNERMDFPDDTWEGLYQERVYDLNLLIEFT